MICTLTPQYLLIKSQRLLCIRRYLLGLGVPIDIPMKDQSTALDLAVFGGHLAAVSLLAHREDATVAASSDWRSRRNDHQCTVAHWAGMGGSVRVIAWLLRHGCATRTPLHAREESMPLSVTRRLSAIRYVCVRL